MNIKDAVKDAVKNFYTDQDGVGTIEIIMILVVLIALVVIFREKIIALLRSIFDNIDDAAQEVYG